MMYRIYVNVWRMTRSTRFQSSLYIAASEVIGAFLGLIVLVGGLVVASNCRISEDGIELATENKAAMNHIGTMADARETGLQISAKASVRETGPQISAKASVRETGPQKSAKASVMEKANEEAGSNANVVKPSSSGIKSKPAVKAASDGGKVYLGKYYVTAYCGCIECCGKEDGITLSGKRAVAGSTVAVDSGRIKYGTVLYIDGVGNRTAQDGGGAVHGNRIDVYCSTHEEAVEFGRQYLDVYRLN